MHKFLIVFVVLTMGSLAVGQSVLEVPADVEGTPVTNALIQYVVADTNASGEQLHDIYKLQRGKTYFYNQSPIFKNPITLIADPPGDTDETKPPQLLITTDDEGGTPYEHAITTFADLTVKAPLLRISCKTFTSLLISRNFHIPIIVSLKFPLSSSSVNILN